MTVTGSCEGVLALAQRFMTLLLSNKDRPGGQGGGGLLDLKLSASPTSLESARNTVNIALSDTSDALRAEQLPTDTPADRLSSASLDELTSDGRDSLTLGISIISESGATALAALNVNGGQ